MTTSDQAKRPGSTNILTIVAILSVIAIIVIPIVVPAASDMEQASNLPDATALNGEVDSIPDTIQKIKTLRFIKDGKKVEDKIYEFIGMMFLNGFNGDQDNEDLCKQIGRQVENFSLSIALINGKRVLVKGEAEEKPKNKLGGKSSVSYEDALKEINPVMFQPVLLVGFKDAETGRKLLTEKTKLQAVDPVQGRDAYMLKNDADRLEGIKKSNEYYYDGGQNIIVFDDKNMYFGNAAVINTILQKKDAGDTLNSVLGARGLSEIGGNLVFFVDPSEMAKRYTEAFKASGLNYESKVIIQNVGLRNREFPLELFQIENVWLQTKEEARKLGLPELDALIATIDDGRLEPLTLSIKNLDGNLVSTVEMKIPESVYELTKEEMVESTDFSDLYKYFPKSTDAVISASLKTEKSMTALFEKVMSQIESNEALKNEIGILDFERFKEVKKQIEKMMGITLDDLDAALDWRVAICATVPESLFGNNNDAARAEFAQSFIIALGLKDSGKADEIIKKIVGVMTAHAERPAHNQMPETRTMSKEGVEYKYIGFPFMPGAGLCWCVRDNALLITIFPGAMETALSCGEGKKDRLEQADGFGDIFSYLPKQNVFFVATNISKVWDMLVKKAAEDKAGPEFDEIKEYLDLSPESGAIWTAMAASRNGRIVTIKDSGMGMLLAGFELAYLRKTRAKPPSRPAAIIACSEVMTETQTFDTLNVKLPNSCKDLSDYLVPDLYNNMVDQDNIDGLKLLQGYKGYGFIYYTHTSGKTTPNPTTRAVMAVPLDPDAGMPLYYRTNESGTTWQSTRPGAQPFSGLKSESELGNEWRAR